MRFLILSTYAGIYECELEYASCVARELVPALEELGHEVRVVERPYPEDANKAISEFDPDVVWFVGHGAPYVVTLERVKIWISDRTHCGSPYGDRNKDVVKDKIVNALSCLTASCLGKSLTKYHGCKYWFGYYKPFVFLACGGAYFCKCPCGAENPFPDVRNFVLRFAMICMHEANVFFLLGLAKGFTPEQAHGYSLARFDQWIEFWRGFEPKSNAEKSLAALALDCLYNDKNIQRLCKDGEYVGAEEPPEKPPEITEKAVVQVVSVPSGATVYVNGRRYGRTPIAISLDPGEYVIRCEYPGYEPLERRIRVEAAHYYLIRFVLRRVARRDVLRMASLPLAFAAVGYGLSKLKK